MFKQVFKGNNSPWRCKYIFTQSGDVTEKVKGSRELKALGLQGVALGWVLQYGDVKENIESAKKLKKSGISNYNIGLDVRRKSIIDFTKSS